MQQKRIGGRQKGTPNKTTAEIRAKYQSLIESCIDGLKSDLQSLEPKERIKAVIELSKFVIPTMKATELFSEGPQKIKVRITGLPKESNRAQNL